MRQDYPLAHRVHTNRGSATEDDLDMDREIEYAFDTDEPLTGTRGPVGDVE
jgi:hypothetical protein